MDRRAHWESVYREKESTMVSWYRPHLETSLELIARFAGSKQAAILDIGGGASTLVDDLLAAGYDDVSVLDIADDALEVSRHRLGDGSARVHWVAADFLNAKLETERYDLCHDRAVFHFLTNDGEKSAYLEQVARILRPEGVLVLATFSPDGPEKCSGLEVSRYGEEALKMVTAERFVLVESRSVSHHTPTGAVQEMMYFVLRKTSSPAIG
ncbi:class I SAM-dependent methyltransferase [Edaphobacter flagellatus]|uniref:class I SAM-dependent methyltransferase n=1 Tax=Edaphobacter flagellatus TaxID=1933044 RepID=UPI0021B18803|nr:class I SAM-dependent methyltransferase [Edaphobacter flagellatus]